jgi:hypothetical protein
MQSIEVDRHQNAKKSSVAKDDAIRAPIHDPLVQKNHRREQSANATAGGREKGCWGDNNDDARKAGSCERAEKDQDYQMIGTQMTKTDATAEKMKRLISPSPETTQPRGTPTVTTNST